MEPRSIETIEADIAATRERLEELGRLVAGAESLPGLLAVEVPS